MDDEEPRVGPPLRVTKPMHAIMRALAELDNPPTGYALCQHTKMGPGSIYPALERLENELGWIEGIWVPAAGYPEGRRRVYTTTSTGPEKYTEATRLQAERRERRRSRRLLRRWRQWRGEVAGD